MGVLILMYHAIHERRSVIATHPRTFSRQMRWLKDSKRPVISLAQAIRGLTGHEPGPQNAIVVTFDDGFTCLYENAFPILEELGIPATIFLVTGHVGGKNDWPGQPEGIPRLPLLRWSQIEEMDRHGIEFGSHTRHHPRLDHTPENDLMDEIITSRDVIQEQLGHPILTFAYPYGLGPPAARALVQQAYLGACTTRLGMANPASDPHALERVDAYYLQHPAIFQRLTSPLFPLYLAGRRLLRAAARATLPSHY